MSEAPRTSMGKLLFTCNPFPLLWLMSISFCCEDTEYYQSNNLF